MISLSTTQESAAGCRRKQPGWPFHQMLKAAGRVWAKFPAQFAYWGGAALLFLGTAHVIGAFGKSQVLDIQDPLLGIPIHYVMLVVGIVQLAASGLLLFTNWRTVGLGLMAWITADFLVYRVGLWSMGWHRSSGFLFEPLGLSLGTTDAITSLLSVLLLVGSCVILWTERRKALAAESLKISCHACGGHIKFAIANLGQKIPCPHCQAGVILRKPDDNLRMSCFFCQGHIEFPAHAIGQKLKCPHCHMDIGLKEPA